MILSQIIYFLIGLLVLVWPMPNIIAVRNIDIGLLFIVSFINFFMYKQLFFKSQKKEKIIFISIFLFIMWAVFISFLSSFRNECFYELKAFLNLFLLGGSAYFIINTSNIDYKKLFLIIFSVLMIFPIYHSLYSLHYYLLHHHFPFRSYGITKGLDELNFMMPYLLTFFSVEIIFRFLNKKTFLSISNSFFSLLLFIVLFSLIIQAKRNGIVSIAFMILSIIFFIKLVAHSINKKTIILSMIGLIVGSVLVFLNIKDDSRWRTLQQTIPIALDLQHNQNWLFPHSMSLPKLSNGQIVATSNYQRIAWIKAGVIEIYRHPFGVGYSRNAFRHALLLDYPKVGKHLAHSHSGMIDLGIGTGMIGIILWSIFIFSLVYFGFKQFIIDKSYFGLFVFYLSTSFYFRMFLDSINRDHMLQQFIFFVFLGFFAIYKEQNEKNNLPSS